MFTKSERLRDESVCHCSRTKLRIQISETTCAHKCSRKAGGAPHNPKIFSQILQSSAHPIKRFWIPEKKVRLSEQHTATTLKPNHPEPVHQKTFMREQITISQIPPDKWHLTSNQQGGATISEDNRNCKCTQIPRSCHADIDHPFRLGVSASLPRFK